MIHASHENVGGKDSGEFIVSWTELAPIIAIQHSGKDDEKEQIVAEIEKKFSIVEKEENVFMVEGPSVS